MNLYGPVNAFLNGATQTGTFGFNNNIVGGAVAPILKYMRPDLFGDQGLGQIYNDATNVAQNNQNTLNEQYPVSSGLGMLAGDIGNALLATKALQGLGMLNQDLPKSSYNINDVLKNINPKKNTVTESFSIAAKPTKNAQAYNGNMNDILQQRFNLLNQEKRRFGDSEEANAIQNEINKVVEKMKYYGSAK
jgi:hypothetical protein